MPNRLTSMLVSGALATLSACAGASTEPDAACKPGFPTTQQYPRLATGCALRAGRVRPAVFRPFDFDCAGKPVRASGVQASVTDESGREVPSTLEGVGDTRMTGADIRDRTWVGEEARLLFSAAPGTYTAAASFEVGGRTDRYELEVLVSPDRTTEVAEELPFLCEVVDRTASGAWLCDGRVIRDSVQVQTLRERAVTAVVADVVWEVRDAGIVRYVDPGKGQLLLEGSGDLAGQAAARAATATNEDLFVEGGGKVVRYHFDRASETIRAAGSVQAEGALLLAAPRLYACASYFGETTCSVSSVEGEGLELLASPFAVLPGTAVGVAQGGLWTLDTRDVVRFFRATPDDLREAGHSKIPSGMLTARPLVLRGGCPSLSDLWLAPSASGGTIVWKQFRYRAPQQVWIFGPARLNDHFVWEVGGGSGLPPFTRVFTR